jgi:hypothetical protein
MTLRLNPLISPLHIWVLILTVSTLTVLILAHSRRRPSLPLTIPLRAGIVLLLGLILLDPVVDSASTSRGRRPFLLLVDTSRSMTTPDADSSPGRAASRWEATRDAILGDPALMGALSAQYDVRVFGFDSGLRPVTLEQLVQLSRPDGDSTDLGDSIEKAIAGCSPPTPAPTPGKPPPLRGAILVVSDGRDNRSNPLDAARLARAEGFPLYTVCVGRETRPRDIQVAARSPQVFGAPGQPIDITAVVTDVGFPEASVRLDLLREGRRMATRELQLRPGSIDVTFRVAEPHKGFYRYALAGAVVPGETNELNNRCTVFLNVLDNRTRVLLLEGEPSWDTRFLADALRDDPTITLDSIVQLTDQHPFALSGSPDRPVVSPPHTLEDFSHYDVVILGRACDPFFDHATAAALKRWVQERGGNVLFLRGAPAEHVRALEDLEPLTLGTARLEDLKARLTDAGRSYPGFTFDSRQDADTIVKRLPDITTATEVRGEKALAVVLVRAQRADQPEDAPDLLARPMALVAYERYGQGKTMAVAGEGLWHWALLPPDLSAFSHVYSELWTQTVRWLVSESDFLPGMDIALRTDRTAYSTRDTVRFLGFARGAGATRGHPQVSVEQPDGKSVTIGSSSGAALAADFTASYRPPEPGEYVASVRPTAGGGGPVTTAFTVYPGQEEDANRSADPLMMKAIAELSGGEALSIATARNLPEKLHALEQAAAAGHEPVTAWDRGWVLALLLLLLTGEWAVRRRSGLP